MNKNLLSKLSHALPENVRLSISMSFAKQQEAARRVVHQAFNTNPPQLPPVQKNKFPCMDKHLLPPQGTQETKVVVRIEDLRS